MANENFAAYFNQLSEQIFRAITISDSQRVAKKKAGNDRHRERCPPRYCPVV